LPNRDGRPRCHGPGSPGGRPLYWPHALPGPARAVQTEEFHRMPPFRRLLRWALLAFAALSVLGLLAAGTLYFVVASKLPDVEALRTVELQEPMYVHARDGKLIALFGETRRYPVDIKEVPEAIKQAFIAIEDNRFYEHHGVDYKGVARAIWLLATT